MLISAVGRREFIDIAEFKNSDDIGYQIEIEPQTDDIETKMGKQLALNHVIQYAGQQLGPDAIGKIIRTMPYTNQEEATSDLTLDYDNATSDILALDRGEPRPANKHDNHKYVISRLINRMKQGDFKFLPEDIQGMYEQKLQEHEQKEAEQQQAIQAAQAGFIPTSGYLVVCDLYVPDPNDAGNKTGRRARLPYDSLKWLLEKLQQQGSSQEDFNQMEQSAMSDISQMITDKGLAPLGGQLGAQQQGAAPEQGMAS
jgi:hypothetical protein